MQVGFDAVEETFEAVVETFVASELDALDEHSRQMWIAAGGAQVRFLVTIVPDSLLAAVAKSDKALHRLLRRLNNGTTPAQPLLDFSVAGLRTFVAKPPFPKRMRDDELRQIHVPTLVLFCECSPVNHAQRAAERARELIAHAVVEVVAGSGHMLPVQEPTLFSDRVLEFIGNVDGA